MIANSTVIFAQEGIVIFQELHYKTSIGDQFVRVDIGQATAIVFDNRRGYCIVKMNLISGSQAKPNTPVFRQECGGM
jgi:hypothetical protein